MSCSLPSPVAVLFGRCAHARLSLLAPCPSRSHPIPAPSCPSHLPGPPGEVSCALRCSRQRPFRSDRTVIPPLGDIYCPPPTALLDGPPPSGLRGVPLRPACGPCRLELSQISLTRCLHCPS